MGDFIFLSHSKGDFFLKNFLPPPPPGYLMVRPLGIYIYSMSGPLRLAALNQK